MREGYLNTGWMSWGYWRDRRNDHVLSLDCDDGILVYQRRMRWDHVLKALGDTVATLRSLPSRRVLVVNQSKLIASFGLRMQRSRGRESWD